MYADAYALFLTCLLCLSAIAIIVFLAYFKDIDKMFSSWPWKAEQTGGVVNAQIVCCPFTGDKPTMRCNICGCSVSQAAFHDDDVYILSKTYFGNMVICWDLAAEAVACGEAIKGRQRLDAIIDFKGNYLINATAPACIGCTTWVKTNNLSPRISITHICLGMIFAMVPYAFNGSLENANAGGIVNFTVSARLHP